MRLPRLLMIIEDQPGAEPETRIRVQAINLGGEEWRVEERDSETGKGASISASLSPLSLWSLGLPAQCNPTACAEHTLQIYPPCRPRGSGWHVNSP